MDSMTVIPSLSAGHTVTWPSPCLAGMPAAPSAGALSAAQDKPRLAPLGSERPPARHHPHQALVREDAQGPVTVLAGVVLLASPA